MRATLEFELPEDEDEFEDAQKGSAYRTLLWYVLSKLRRFGKDQDKFEELIKAVDELREDIFREAAELGVEL